MGFFLMERKFSIFSEFRDSNKSQKHALGSIQILFSHMCFAGTVLASWYLKLMAAGSKPVNDKYF